MKDKSDQVTTREEACKTIEEIARRKGTFTDAFRREAKIEAKNGRRGMLEAMEGSEEIREDLSKSLKIISTDLYTSEARFLMEVIQNADDNKYVEGQTPMVSITVFPKHVKIECNELGFSRENVKALCRTARSSKPPGQGYTGEKGIGFKSLFKLANRVHIRSEPYYFQLDQTRDLGMITPQWDEDFFDDYAEEHQTTIVLDHICNGPRKFSSALQKDVDGIDPALLIFLRRIERLHLTLFQSSSDVKPAFRKRFRRVRWTSTSGIVSLEDEDAKTMYHFYKQHFTAKFNGVESRRPNVTETDVVLAFPTTERSGSYIPLIRDHNFAFAWLPLVDLGFKFVIQADFLTTSNRQSVDEDNDWNINIAEAIPHAFKAAVKKFNRSDSGLQELARTWPLYLNSHSSGLSPYWHKIRKNINEHLGDTCTIKNQNGSIKRPKDLMFLDWACDRKGEPMFGSKGDYISQDYPDTVREAISWLGVTTPDWDWVCDKLEDLHSKRLLGSKMKSAKWCSDLARVILKSVPSNDAEYARDLEEIPLIPLTDGTWRSAPSEDDPIYFPASLGVTIPPGLPLSMVEENASACPVRKKLFRLLGVRDCDVSSVIERILAYHRKLRSAQSREIIAQLKYLYKMREHLQDGDMKKIYFVCSPPISAPTSHIRKGTSTYANISSGGKLQKLFSGNSEIDFLHEDYFVDLNPTERVVFAEWLRQTAEVALAPRFIAASSHEIHADFKWLLDNRSDRVLATLRQNWSMYKEIITRKARDTLANHEFLCWSGSAAALGKTRIPLHTLVQKTKAFGKVSNYHFLALPSGDPEDWKFLSDLSVDLDDGLSYFLWVLCQSGFQEHVDVDKSKKLYLEIQSRAFSPSEKDRVNEAFDDLHISLGNRKFAQLRECFWDAPKGFPSKPVLRLVYGTGLEPLFRDILKVPNVTSAEARRYLKKLQGDKATALEDAIEVYLFLQDHYPNDCQFDEKVACVAIPSRSKSALTWKTPAQCVWDDKEFSQNKIELKSKIALRPIVEQQMPAAKTFFTHVLKLPNAGIHELLADLALMQAKSCNDSKRIYQIYKRIESCRRTYSQPIIHAFKARPLVFLRGLHNGRDQWVSLEDCVWARSVLRSRHALISSLNQYRDLFRHTLKVPNATRDMLVTELLDVTDTFVDDEDECEYVKELLQEIARSPWDDKDLERLHDRACWPCRKPTNILELCSIGSFYVNDRQDLFDMFSDSHTFLDCSFDNSKRLTDLLRSRGCESFLSRSVSITTECREPLRHDRHLTVDFRGRADYLAAYFKDIGSKSPYELQTLLKNAEVWMSADIRTHYKLEGMTVTKSEGGSSATVCTEEDEDGRLNIYVSMDRQTRECALLTDFPMQLVAALELKPAHFPDLHLFLQVPLNSLRTLMIRKGFTGGDDVDHCEQNLVAVLNNQDMQSHSELGDDDNQDEVRELATSLVDADSTEHVVIYSTSASASSEAAHTALQPSVRSRPSIRPTALEPRPNEPSNMPSDVSPHRRPVTPRPTILGPYSAQNRDRNRDQLRGFARNMDRTPVPRLSRSNRQSRNPDSAFDLSALSQALETTGLAPVPESVQVDSSSRQRAGPIPNRNDEQRARDFEVGFLGEQFVYNLLHDTLELPDFTGEENWTSSLRSRAGFSTFGHEVSDFTYKDTQGVLTRHFLHMPHQYAVPEWLASTCSNGNVPLYRLEVKSTTSQEHTTPFYMSGSQYKLAERLQVTSATPSEIYVILRVSGLNALEDDAQARPQWRVYLDPYACGAKSVLKFVAPTYVVTPTA